jgi:hypothetical protein
MIQTEEVSHHLEFFRPLLKRDEKLFLLLLILFLNIVHMVNPLLERLHLFQVLQVAFETLPGLTFLLPEKSGTELKRICPDLPLSIYDHLV